MSNSKEKYNAELELWEMIECLYANHNAIVSQNLDDEHRAEMLNIIVEEYSRRIDYIYTKKQK